MKYKALFLFLLLMLSFSAVVAQDTVSLTYLVDDSQNSQDSALALAEAFMAENPNVTITIESRPGGADGDDRFLGAETGALGEGQKRDCE